jgi:hypothetical protein
MKHLIPLCSLVLLLAACAGAPPPANWKMNAVSLLEHAQQRWLEGDSSSAELALDKMRADIAQSGRIDLLARAELAACASRVASLDFAACAAYAPLAVDAGPSEQAYARFLSGDWVGLDAKSLPPHYARLIVANNDADANQAAREIKDPLPRLIAAGLLLQGGRADPVTQGVAVDTASERGWRRPLLAWLEVRRKGALEAGEVDAAEQLQRRIDLVLHQTKVNKPLPK